MRRCCLPSSTARLLRVVSGGAYAPQTRSLTSTPLFHQQQWSQDYSRRGGRGGGAPSARGQGRGRGGRAPHSQSNRSRGGPIKDRYPPITVDLADPRRRLAILVDGTNSNLLSSCATRQDILSHSSLFTNVVAAVRQVGVPVLLRVFAHQLPAEWEPLLLPPSPTPASAPSMASFQAGQMGRTAANVVAINDAATPSHGSGNPVVVPLPAMDSAEDGHRSTSGSRARASGEEADTVVSVDSQQQGSMSGVVVEYFRVERFIPIPMQMEADAQHLYDFRFQNKIEGVCYVCHEVDRALYEALMDQQLGRNGSASSTDDETSAALLPPLSRVSATDRAHEAFFNQYLFDELGLVKDVSVDGRSPDGS